MHRHKLALSLCLCVCLALPAFAQQSAKQALAQGQAETLIQAEQVLQSADQAGAGTLASSLMEDARWRLRFAQENWTANKDQTREQARLRANEALWAGRAALAKARWLSTNTAIRGLQEDIRRFGGTAADVALVDEPSTMTFTRGANSKARVDFAQSIIDQAKAAGASSIPGNDLVAAQQNLDTARKIIRGDANSENADHLAYTAEMMARRAYYLARQRDVEPRVQPLQLERTRLAQAASERQAAEERAQREAAQRQAADLQRQLAAEQANRESQQAEVQRLQQQIEENRRAMEQRLETDRAAREAAERALDETYQKYQAAISSSSASDVETLRRQIEDQQIALRAIQSREQLNEQAMSAEIQGLRNELSQARGGMSADAIAQREQDITRREQELEQLRRAREQDLAQRQQLEQQQRAAIDEATRRRQEAEAQAQQLKQQVEAAQQAAQQATAAAQQSQQETERMRQQQAQTQAELDKTRQELANRDTEARRLRMETELARLAATRRSDRGFIVTLPGIFFDTGKSVLKPGAKNTLTKIADTLKSSTDVKVSVEGHTDSVGTEAANQKLSEARANAVRDYLVNAGVPSDRITAEGRGESQPVATNKTAAGRQQNRRVELVIAQ